MGYDSKTTTGTSTDKKVIEQKLPDDLSAQFRPSMKKLMGKLRRKK